MPLRKWNFALTLFLPLLVSASFPHFGVAQTSGVGLNPARLEVEVNPGGEKTVGFRIEAPASSIPVQGRLMLTLTDWNIDEQANVTYAEPGTLPNSASPWIIFSPAAITTTSGETHLVRLTIRVPESARPGVYRSGVFVQERPPATPPNPGERLLYFRFRYVFTLYVIVPPVAGHGELLDVRMVSDHEGVKLLYEMRNEGSRHIRPRVTWSIRGSDSREIVSGKNKETPVLLPFAAMNVRIPIAASLPSGEYQVEAQVDFNDGGSIQAVKRTIQLPVNLDKTASASKGSRK
jgi:hypothetical protein